MTAVETLSLMAFAAGLALLSFGAVLLVGAASRLAAGFGVPPLVVGLTVVAWGTSAPEFAVSVLAAASGLVLRKPTANVQSSPIG